MYELRHVCGHIEVYRGGVFQFSADTEAEARQELRALEDGERDD